ncbi:MAG TPA: DUF4340 domain-containing protein [Thermoanaerobaculia bacterium]|jgi:hypothetical protein|nr:DUF4340 domain-containing protein [Thermoanaerobaculia bacterium]
MKPRTLLILLAVVLALGAFIWFYERKLPSSEERVTLGKKVLELDKAEVTAVAIDSSKGKIRLERTGGAGPNAKEGEAAPAVEWRIVQPLAARADSFAVDRLLDGIAALEKTRTLDDVDPKAVGLDKPRAVVRLTTKTGEKVLRLGAEVPPGGSLIVAVPGQKGVYVVGDAILSEVDKGPGEWRDRLVFRGDRERIRSITLSGAAGGPVVLTRRADGFWIERPFADRADHDLVDGLLSDLTGLTADRFLDGDGSRPPTALGLQPPRATVDVAFSGVTPPVRIDLGTAVTGAAAPEGQPSGEVGYARVGDVTFEVRTRLGESALRAPADWRALQLSAFEVHQVDSATVRDGGTALELTRADTDWKRGNTLISYLPVSDLLFAVIGARAERLLTPAESQSLHAGLAKPLLTFELRTKDAGNETLVLYPPVQGGVPARASGREVVLLLPADTLQQIQAKVKAVREAKSVKPEK